MIFSFAIYLLRPLANYFLKNIEGLENLPDKAPYIIAVNHASFADPVFLTVALGRKLKSNISNLYFLAKRKIIWRIFTLRAAEKLFNILIINPCHKKEILKRGEKILNKKNILVIFFEGSRTLTGEIQKGKTGLARLALKSRLPVVPVALRGTREFWGRGKIFPRFKRDVEVFIGSPLTFNKYYDQSVDKRLLIDLTNIIFLKVKILFEQK